VEDGRPARGIEGEAECPTASSLVARRAKRKKRRGRAKATTGFPAGLKKEDIGI